uniref:Uncharacterized protein n=1 Tax=Leersia perrieri TaxID=77586 RepID=A0A0D9VXP6_9ORYZ
MKARLLRRCHDTPAPCSIKVARDFGGTRPVVSVSIAQVLERSHLTSLRFFSLPVVALLLFSRANTPN